MRGEGDTLAGAELRYADLRRADLCGMDLRHADLRGAVLSEADLRDADLRGARLEGAKRARLEMLAASPWAMTRAVVAPLMRVARPKMTELTPATLAGGRGDDPVPAGLESEVPR